MSIKTSFLLLLAVSLHSPGVQCEKVELNFTLTCESEQYWCAELLVYELDYHGYHDPWLFIAVCSSERTAKVSSVTLYPGNDGFLGGNYYEVRSLVYHNCTKKFHQSSYNCQFNQWVADCPPTQLDFYSEPKPIKCACTTPKREDVPMENGHYHQDIVLTDEQHAYSAENAYWCIYPKEFQKIKPDAFGRRWYAPPCEWKGDKDGFKNFMYTFIRDTPDVLAPKFLQ